MQDTIYLFVFIGVLIGGIITYLGLEIIGKSLWHKEEEFEKFMEKYGAL